MATDAVPTSLLAPSWLDDAIMDACKEAKALSKLPVIQVLMLLHVVAGLMAAFALYRLLRTLHVKKATSLVGVGLKVSEYYRIASIKVDI